MPSVCVCVYKAELWLAVRHFSIKHIFNWYPFLVFLYILINHLLSSQCVQFQEKASRKWDIPSLPSDLWFNFEICMRVKKRKDNISRFVFWQFTHFLFHGFFFFPLKWNQVQKFPQRSPDKCSGSKPNQSVCAFLLDRIISPVGLQLHMHVFPSPRSSYFLFKLPSSAVTSPPASRDAPGPRLPRPHPVASSSKPKQCGCNVSYGTAHFFLKKMLPNIFGNK